MEKSFLSPPSHRLKMTTAKPPSDFQKLEDFLEGQSGQALPTDLPGLSQALAARW